MRNVRLDVSDGVALDVTSLDGLLTSRTDGPPVFDDPGSYVLQIQSAELVMRAAPLTRLLNEQVFAGEKSPLRNVTVTIASDGVQVEGRLRKGIEVPFSMASTVDATADGRLRLHATSIKTAGIPVNGMLDLFGVELENLVKLPAGKGIQADEDDLLLNPFAMLPEPATEGRVKAIRLTNDGLVMSATGAARLPQKPASRPDPRARNFLYFYGGTITFGKLTMSDADMQLIDADPRDPFEFFPARYLRQLVAGYSRNTERGGLRVTMPDYHRVRTSGRTLAPPPVG